MTRAISPMWAMLLGLTILTGCGAGGMAEWNDATPTEALDQNASTALYIYPPDKLGIPAQLIPNANLQSGRVAELDLDTGTEVSGAFVLDPVEADGEPQASPQSVPCQVTAWSASTGLAYQGQTGLEAPNFQLLVPEGTYHLQVTPVGGFQVPPQVYDVAISRRGNGVLELPELDEGVPLTVLLTDKVGSPLEHARVYTLDEATGLPTSLSLSAGDEVPGEYRLLVAQVPQVLWLGSLDAAHPLVRAQLATLDPTADMAPLEFNYRLSAFELGGIVTDLLGTVAEGVTVFATRQAEAEDGSFQAQTSTDATGRFSLMLPEGDYTLVFRPPPTLALSGMTMFGVTVSEGGSRWVSEVKLAGQVEVSVLVRAPDGSPLPGVSVIMTSQDQANPATSGMTDEEGISYLTVGVGNFQLEAYPPAEGEMARAVASVLVAADTTALEDVTLEQGFSTYLRLLNDDLAAPGVVVQAWRMAGDGGASAMLASGVTDDLGEMRLVLPLASSGI